MTTYGQPALQEELLDAVEESLITVNLPGRYHLSLMRKENDDVLSTSAKANEAESDWQHRQPFSPFC